MPIKVCYKNEIHRVAKTPQDFNALLQAIKEMFNNELPERFNLQYEDSEGDRIVLGTSEDYKVALESELSNTSKTLKIYLTDAGDVNNTSIISKNILDELNESSLTKSEKKEVPPPEKEEKISKAIAPESNTSNSFIQTVIENPVVCDQINHAVNQLFIKKAKNHGKRGHGKRWELSEVPCDCKVEVKTGEKPCRVCKGSGFLSQRALKKREKVQNMIKDTLRQELPTIVHAVKELIQNPGKPVEKVLPRAVQMEEKKFEEPKTSNKPIHHRVECDVCGVCPIVGVRYKCSVTENYDICENCEAIVDHPYPLLKIKNDSQHPIQVITILNEDAPQQCPQQRSQPQERQQHNFNWGQRRGCNWTNRCNPEKMQEKVQQFLNHLPGLSTEQKTNLGNVASSVITNITSAMNSSNTQAQQAKTENKEAQKPQNVEYDASFVKVTNTIPEKPEVKDLIIYQSVSIKNEGLKVWPKNSFIESEGEIVGETCQLPSIEPGREFPTVLVIRSPAKAGKFQSKWRFGYIDEKGQKKIFGKNFAIEFEIAGENEMTVEKEVPKKEKTYSPEILKKAQAIIEIFPQIDIEEVCKFIEDAPTTSLEELMQYYLALLDN